MIRICVIGDIGSGKTHISKLLAGTKYPLFNADYEVGKIYASSRQVFAKLTKAIPKFIKSFPTQKQELTEAILNNKNNLRKIINIIHPEVRKKMNLFLAKNKKKKILVLDIPLLLENKLNVPEDVIIFVSAKQKLIQKNLQKRFGYNKKTVDLLKKIQLDVESKKLAADIIIENDFKLKQTRLRVKQILDNIVI
jgi:dephospho-CoA kinase